MTAMNFAPASDTAFGFHDTLHFLNTKNHMKTFLAQIKSFVWLAAIFGWSLAGAVAQTNGTVVAWGYNGMGQTQVPSGLGGVIAISGGGWHSLALRSDGTVLAWGYNGMGQTQVPAGLSNVIAIAAGYDHSLALKSSGTPVGWGYNLDGQTNVPAGLSNVIAIATGDDHNLALKSDRTVAGWGANGFGQTDVPIGLSNVVGIAGGSQHSLALKSDGTVVAWGRNAEGQTNVPVGLSGVIAIAAGGNHSLALRSNGTVVAWGYNNQGQTNVPVNLNSVVAIGGGGYHSLALKSNGAVVAWGYNNYGQSSVPPSLGSVVGIAAGNEHSLALCGAPLSIMGAPGNQTAATGWAVEFRVVVLGIPPLACQWFFNATNSIGGATNPVLYLTDVQPSQSGAYTVVITNASGSATSSPALLSVTDVQPVIGTQPNSQVSSVGLTVDFSVEASGSLPLAYQWVFNGTSALVGATNSTLQLTAVQTSQAGVYSVIVTNAYGAVTSSPATLTLFPSNTVPAASEAFLRAVIASGANPVKFAFDGTITLINMIEIEGDTVLDATGHRVTISGGGRVPVFFVAPNVTLTLLNLTVTNGASTDFGGGIYIAGQLNATNCMFCANGTYRPASIGGDDALPACGGAIYNAGTLNASQCSFLRNQAVAGAGGNGTAGGYFGTPGYGHAGGSAFGGGIYNVGTMIIDRSLFASNSAVGGAGGSGGDGDIFTYWPCPDQSGGNGGGGGAGGGGDVFNSGTGTVVNCTFAWNMATGGAGGRGGYGGLINWNPHSASGCPGGNGGGGGGGFGTIYQAGGQLHLNNCTVAQNAAVPGSGGAAGGGSLGRPNGLVGGNGSAWGGITSSGSILVNTLLATNSPGGNGSGVINDLGHNLSSDGTCAFTNVGSLNNTDPKLGSLANNGGPTLTMALSAGSPAIDAGDTSAAPPSDQRGFPRPVGPAADIGAFEYCFPAVLRINRSGETLVDITAYGNMGQSCRLLASTNLSNWVPIATNQIGMDGTLLYHENCIPGGACRFYRLAMP